MKANIPAETKLLIAKHKTNGDFSEISRRLVGDETEKGPVRRAMLVGFGKVGIIKGIIEYYAEKDKAL